VFSVLPYLEAGNVHSTGSGAGVAKAAALGKMLQTPVPVLICPSRRGPELRPFLGQFPLHNAIKPAQAFKNDYAGCGGDERLKNGEGPADDTPAALRAYQWPHANASGVFFAGSRVRSADITDGLSHSYLAGEKYVRMRPARSPQDRDFGDDQAAYIGDDRDIRRWTEEPPLRDQRDLDAPDSFGSRHPSSWNALFADGSVHSLSYTLDAEIHRAQGNRHDGGR
jgi:prepilin-type processing-associated H-X9-DG protein